MVANQLLQLSRYFIALAEESQRPITNKKLQKLLYYSQAWYLVLKGKPLFDEQIEAWPHGPVIPEIYHHYKKSGFDIITEVNPTKRVNLKQDIKDFLKEIWEVYGKYDASYLEALSHSEDPWIKARSSLDERKSKDIVISHDSMKIFYLALLKKENSKETSYDQNSS